MTMAYDPDMAASTETLTFSNLYPNRPIRPLPKRRIRERLSPEVAETIRYPPSTRPASIFYPPYPTDIPEEYRGHELASTGGPDEESGDEVRHFVGAGSGRQNGARFEVTEDSRESRSANVARPPPEISNAYSSPRQQQPKTEHTRHTSAILPPSDLSADGYESFENTNNKKKRKIPTAGDSSLSGSHAVSDGGSMPVAAGIASAHMQGDGTVNSQYAALNGTSANNKGISGAGRGMFGRARNGRSPLRTLPNANNWTDRNSKLRPSRQWGPPSAESPAGGIISSAIAKAGKDSARQGQENVSLLQHSAVNRTSPASTQFTFTCESQVPGTYRGDLSGLPPPGYIPAKGPAMAHGMDTMNDQGAGRHDTLPKGGSQGSAGRQRRTRKSIDRELEEQARQRRAKTRENRRRNPLPIEEEWVCDFCIYESIWGEPPAAIIRAYEERERRERIAEMNKKRRLEQVKARSRKSKKQAKNGGGKTGNVAKSHHDVPEHDAHEAVHEDVGSEVDDITSEEYVDESFHPLDEVDDGDLSPIPGDVHKYTHNGFGDDGGGGFGRGGDEIHGPAK